MSDPISQARIKLAHYLRPPDGPDTLQTRKFNRVACPVCRAFPTLPVNSNTCLTGEPDMPRLRTHLKDHHSCDCPDATGDVCPNNKNHVTAGLLKKMRSVKKLPSESSAEHWLRMYAKLPHQDDPCPWPHVPSAEQLIAVIVSPTLEFKNQVVAKFRQWESPGADGDTIWLGFCQRFLVFFELVSRGGTLPDFSTPRPNDINTNSDPPPSMAHALRTPGHEAPSTPVDEETTPVVSPAGQADAPDWVSLGEAAEELSHTQGCDLIGSYFQENLNEGAV